MVSRVESGYLIAGSTVKRILTCCVPEAPSYLVATPKRLLDLPCKLTPNLVCGCLRASSCSTPRSGERLIPPKRSRRQSFWRRYRAWLGGMVRSDAPGMDV